MENRVLIVAAALMVVLTADPAAAAHSLDSPCGFEHPQKAKGLKASMVQAFLSCGNFSNAMTETGVPSCAPPETFRELSGAPSDGWSWNELKSSADISIKAAKNKRTTPEAQASGGVTDSADVDIQLKLKGIEDSTPNGASGTGLLSTLSRATLRDRQNTPGNNGDDVPMTVIDFPVTFNVFMSGGHAQVKTTANASVETLTGRSLPKCTSIELIDLGIKDRNGDTFARLGTLLPFK